MPVSKNKLVFGRHPVLEIIHAGNPIEKILLQQDIRGDFEKELRHLCRNLQIPIQVVHKSFFPFLHNYILLISIFDLNMCNRKT